MTDPNEFIKEYKVICLKHGFLIAACSCCGSPWIVEIDIHNELEEHLEHLQEEWNK